MRNRSGRYKSEWCNKGVGNAPVIEMTPFWLKHIAPYTLYTALPHGEIKQKFSKIFQKVFNREAKPFINVNMMGAVFSSTASSKACSFRYEDLMEILEFILDNIFVRYGNVVYKQIIGIPIGLDSGQDIANLLL